MRDIFITPPKGETPDTLIGINYTATVQAFAIANISEFLGISTELATEKYNDLVAQYKELSDADFWVIDVIYDEELENLKAVIFRLEEEQ